jgi:hypothetical protein
LKNDIKNGIKFMSKEESANKKIKVSDIKPPVIIYDIDNNEKKNKIMTVLGVKWRKRANPEFVDMCGNDSIRIPLDGDVFQDKYSPFYENDYKDHQHISYNDIIFDEPKINPITIYLYQFKYKWQIGLSRMLPDFLNKFIFKKYLKIMNDCKLKSVNDPTYSEDIHKIEVTFEYKENK